MHLSAMEVWVFPFILQLTMVINADPVNRQCPPLESIAPCTCKQITTGPAITCIRVGEALIEAVSALKGYTIAQLKLIGPEFDSAPVDSYIGLHIEDLTVSEAKIKEPLDPEHLYFRGLENSLTTLEISKSFKTTPLNILRVSNLRHLKDLLLTENGIREVTKDWFSGGQLIIETLIFERNNIKSVGDEAFASLKNLRTFALAGNSLTQVSRSMLPQPANHLSNLDLAYNNIKDIPGNFFEDMPALRQVNLIYNALTTLPETAMSSVWNQLLELSLDGNALQCDDKIKWICSSSRVSVTGKCRSPSETSGKSLTEFCK